MGLPEALPARLVAAADLGFAQTEAPAPDTGSHRRLFARGAFAVAATPWLHAGASLDGRYETHPDDAEGADDSLSGLPVLRLRAFDVQPSLAFGAEVAAEFPGEDAPSVDLAATTLNFEGLLSFTPRGSALSLASRLGYRWDNGVQAAPDLTRLRRGDRFALGLSEHDAVLIGLGAGYRVGDGLLLAEVTLDALLGADDFGHSPKRVMAGYRHQATSALQLEVLIGTNLGKIPAVEPDSPLLAIEPRLIGSLGARLAFGAAAAPGEDRPRTLPIGPTPRQGEQKKAKPVAPPATFANVAGVVRDGAGVALPQVEVRLRVAEQNFTRITDASGRYTFESVPFGKGQLSVETVDYQPAAREVEIGGDGSPVVLPAVQLELAVLAAQIQGFVQSFGGAPVTGASVVVTPPGQAHPVDADGRFSIDVSPGKYEIVISAPGYAPQTHVVTVDEKAVVVVNADLRKGR